MTEFFRRVSQKLQCLVIELDRQRGLWIDEDDCIGRLLEERMVKRRSGLKFIYRQMHPG